MVSVTIQATTPDDIDGAVAVESWLPGGLEPLLDLDAPGGADDFESCGMGFGRGFTYGWWWRCPRWERETKADRVTWYAGRGLRAGTFTHSFEAIAATVGDFALPPAQVMVVMQPEVLGLSTGGTFQVVAIGELSEEEMALSVPSSPNGCPADCSGNGICDVVTGTCQCSADAAGVDCSEAALPLAMELGVQQSDDPTLVALIGLDADADWVGAISDDDLVVPSSSIIVDRSVQPPSVRWQVAPGVQSGSATVTVVATRGSKVVYRAFHAGLSIDGLTSTPLQFTPFDEEDELPVQRPQGGTSADDGLDGKTSAAAEVAPQLALLSLFVVPVCGCGLRRACFNGDGGKSATGGSTSATAATAQLYRVKAKGSRRGEELLEAEDERLVGRDSGGCSNDED
jgi:hypothetical protein